MPPPSDEAPGLHAPMTFEERRQSAELLIKAFGPERFTYLLLTTISAAALIALACWLFTQKVSWNTILSLFGPSGVIVFSQGRVLHIWNRTAAILMGTWSEAGR